MKLTHDHISLLEKEILKNRIDISIINDSLVKHLYNAVYKHLYTAYLIDNFSKRRNALEKEYDYVRRDLLKIKYKFNNFSAKGINEGFVYAIGNPAYPEFIKIGSAIDVYDRLNSYQTSSPYRDYYVIDYFFSYNRLNDERYIHSMFDDRNGEWCRTTQGIIQCIFRERKDVVKIRVDRHEFLEFHFSRISIDSTVVKSINDLRAIARYVDIGHQYMLYDTVGIHKGNLIKKLKMNTAWEKTASKVTDYKTMFYKSIEDGFIFQAEIKKDLLDKIISVNIYKKKMEECVKG